MLSLGLVQGPGWGADRTIARFAAAAGGVVAALVAFAVGPIRLPAVAAAPAGAGAAGPRAA
ncbi:MAG TPA: hypothetical protein VGM91_07880 [Conexibacter sp.]